MTPQAELLPPPPPPDPSPGPRRPRRGLVAGAVATVLALVAGAAAFALTQGGRSAEAVPLALRFTPGQIDTYASHQTMDGTVSSDQFGELPIEMEMWQVTTWRVASVAADGTATIEVSTSNLRGRVNGIDVPSTDTPPFEMVIAPDGRIVSAGGFALGGAGRSDGFTFPGMGQLAVILPPDGEAVEPGDTWEREFSEEFPLGDGTIEYSATSTYERNETVGGRAAAVIRSEMPFSAAFTLAFGDLVESLGDEAGGEAPAPEALTEASMGYEGSGSVTQTSVVDLEAERLLRSDSTGSFEMTVEFSGVPGFDGTMEFTGSYTQSLERR